jgi:hypothetical protein
MQGLDTPSFAKNWNVPIFAERTFDPATIGVGVTTYQAISA